MLRLFLHLSSFIAVSALAVSATGVAAPPAAPVPVPVPYPNTASQDSTGGVATGKRMYKPVSGTASSAQQATQQSVSCAATNVQPGNQVASDPEEGGQIAKAGKATGKTSIHSFNITHKVDKSSPMLMDSSGQGTDCR